MKGFKTTIKFITAAAAALAVFTGSSMLTVQAAQADAGTGSYWSSENPPLIYGASSITIPKGTEFDANDTRFRVFAKDFEDGDMTQNLSVTENVEENTAGSYEITYSVTDSHGNRTELKVPVKVVEDEEAVVTVQRTLYTTPSVWNMDLADLRRSNYGDSQHLGIYLPAGASVEARILEGGRDLNINLYGNDSHQESGLTLYADGNWKTIVNVKDGENYDSIPFVTTPVMEKGAGLNTTLLVEIKYGSTVKELNYFHQGDDEEAFRKKWKEEQNTFGVVENDVLTAVVPFADLDKTTKHFDNGFDTLDEFGKYWQGVVAKMDEYVGLEFDPEDPVNQNVRTRYMVKANRHGAGGAYYSGSHVGINNQSIASFFEVNWGGLHEFAHGYQGSLGRGVMGLGEVSNNILGHYIQKDKSVYPYAGNWLGDFPEKEEERNKARLAAGEWPSDLAVRLYAICNLFDYFEGGTTYGKMFQWYRSELNKGRTMTNTDAYAESLADIYQVNVIPYLEAWGLSVGTETRNKVYEMKLPVLSILKDMVGEDSLSTVMEAKGFDEKYEVVDQSAYKNVSGSCTVTVNIDDLSAIKGKKAVIFDGKDAVHEFTVDSEKITLTGLPAGIFTLQMPLSAEHSVDSEYLTIKEGENEAAVTYRRFSDHTFSNAMVLKVQGIYQTFGYELHFNDDYTKAAVKFGGANIGSTDPYVKIFDEEGNPVKEERVTKSGDAFYFSQDTEGYELEIKPGYEIEVYHPAWARVKLYSSLTGEAAEAFSPSEATTRYVVMEGGLRKESMTEEAAREAYYQILKAFLERKITDYRDSATEEELSAPFVNRGAKQEAIIAYVNLKAEDQAPYSDFISRIRPEEAEAGQEAGQADTAPYVGGVGTASIAKGYAVDEFLYQAVSAYDFEDGAIEINDKTTRIETDLDVNTPGTYSVDYFVKDSEGNEGTYTMTVIVHD